MIVLFRGSKGPVGHWRQFMTLLLSPAFSSEVSLPATVVTLEIAFVERFPLGVSFPRSVLLSFP